MEHHGSAGAAAGVAGAGAAIQFEPIVLGCKLGWEDRVVDMVLGGCISLVLVILIGVGCLCCRPATLGRLRENIATAKGIASFLESLAVDLARREMPVEGKWRA